MDVFEIVKAKVPAEQLPSDDAVLALYVAETGQAIKNFCNISSVPSELVFTHAEMTIDAISADQRRRLLSTSGETPASVKSVKEGDVQVTFEGTKTGLGETVLENLLFNYQTQLLRFRKVRW